MPLKWEEDKNPFVENCFGKLHVGANTSPPQIVAQARELKRQMDAGLDVTSVGDVPLDEFTVNNASQILLTPEGRAEEMLLVHWQPSSGVKKAKIQELRKELTKATELPEGNSIPQLRCPAFIFWFVPRPGVELFDLPEWEELGLEHEHTDGDRRLDVVFDE